MSHLKRLLSVALVLSMLITLAPAAMAGQEQAGSHAGTCCNCETFAAADLTLQAEGITVDAHKHSFIHTAYVAPTCTTPGKREFWFCTSCYKVYLDEYGSVQAGWEDLGILPTGHSMVALPEKEPDCTTDGNIACYQCTACKGYFSDTLGADEYTTSEVIKPKLGHLLAGTPAKAATCTESGNPAYWYCSRCRNYYANVTCSELLGTEAPVLEATGHSPQFVAAANPSCTQVGNIGHYYCSKCKGYFSDANCQNALTKDQVEIPALSHNATHFDATDPTCTDDGNCEFWFCSNCKLYYSDAACTSVLSSVAISATGHQSVRVEAAASTCDKAGNIACWQCSKCKLYFSDATCTTSLADSERLLPRPAHQVTYHPYVAATCTEPGEKEHYYCSSCQKNYSDELCTEVITESVTIAALNHDRIDYQAVEPTCTTDGNIAYSYCTRCKKYFSDSTCQTVIQQSTIKRAALSHAPRKIDAKEATCLAPGNNVYYYCSNCKKSFSMIACTEVLTEAEIVIPQLSHSVTKSDVKHAETCIADGNVAYWYCNICKIYYSDANCTQPIEGNNPVIAASGHSLSRKAAQSATCVAEGNREYYVCSKCQTCFTGVDCKVKLTPEEIVIAKIAHSLEETQAKEPDCTTAGNIHFWYCTKCKQYFKDDKCTQTVKQADTVRKALGHKTTSTDAVDPTCTTDGNIAFWFCTREECGKYFSNAECTVEVAEESIYLSSLGHSASHIDAKAPSCIETGNEECYYCSNCKAYYVDSECTIPMSDAERIIPVISHHVADTAIAAYKAPTCLESGNEAYWYCDICEKYYSDKDCTTPLAAETPVIAALGHTTEHHPAKSATCLAAGNKEYWYCTTCKKYFTNGETYSTAEDTYENQIIAIKPHDLTHVDAYAGTCKKNGNVEYWYCRECKNYYTDATATQKAEYASLFFAGPHSEESIPAKAASYTETGLTEGKYCTICNSILTPQNEVPMLTLKKPVISSIDRVSTGNMVSWGAVTGADAYVILRGTSSSNLKELKTVTRTSYTDMSVKTGTKYYYKIQAVARVNGTTVNSSVASAYKSIVAVLSPESVKVARISSGVKVTFTSVANATGYVVERKVGTGSWKTYSPKITDNGDGTMSFNNTGLTTGKKYQYRVAAYTGTETKNIGVAITSSAITAVRATASVKAENVAGGIRITWSRVENGTGYILQRKVGTGSWSTVKTVSDNSILSYSDTNVTAGKKYTYRVYVYYGKTSVKSVATVSAACTYVVRPTAKVSSPETGKIAVKWTRDAKVTGYQIRYSTKKDMSNAKTVSYTGTAENPTKTISKLTSKTTYYVQIRAYKTVSDTKNYSAWSATYKVTVK